MTGSPVTRIVLLAIAVVGALISSIPFLYMLGTALKTHAFVLDPTFWTTEPTLENFARAWGQAGFGQAFVNSVVVASAATVLSVTLSSMLAFAIARFSFPGRSLLYYGILLTLTMPALVLIIPQFVLAKNLGLLNSLTGLIVVYSASAIAFNVFLLRGFFEEIPAELFEAEEHRKGIGIHDARGRFRSAGLALHGESLRGAGDGEELSGRRPLAGLEGRGAGDLRRTQPHATQEANAEDAWLADGRRRVADLRHLA